MDFRSCRSRAIFPDQLLYQALATTCFLDLELSNEKTAPGINIFIRDEMTIYIHILPDYNRLYGDYFIKHEIRFPMKQP